MVHFDDSFTNAKLKELHSNEEERFIEETASRLGFPYVNLEITQINPEAVPLIGEKMARDNNVVAFNIKNKNVSIAAKKPNSIEIQKLVQLLQTKNYIVLLHVCSLGSLEHAWKRYADIIDTSAEKKGVFTVDAEETGKMVERIKHKSDVVGLLSEISTTNNTRRISDTLSLIFAGALSLRASDIHIEPEETGIRLRYRLDGVLHDIADMDNYIYKRLMSRLKLLSGMVLNVKVEAQDGRFTFSSGERKVEVRSSIIPGAVGESVVMRILDPSVASFDLDTINLNKHIEVILKQQLKRPNGLIITTGPTGSGKTTALYAFLREVHDESKKIITIENPVEYKIEGIMHTQTDKDYTFAKGLRAVLRQDPDVIMVGEIRDHEVAETAIHAAQTGHLVFSTLHTNNAIAGFTRLIDMGINPQVLGGAVNLILGQRLVRILCSDCKLPYQAEENEKKMIEHIMSSHPHPITIPKPLMLHRAVGCEICGGTGFKGRMGIFEGVLMDEAVEEVIVRDPRESAIYEAAKPQKIPTMLHDGIEKILGGTTSMMELERVVELPHNIGIDNFVSLTKPEDEPSVDDVDFQSHVV
jgi:type IV pilus assembly protein PilB